MKTRIITALICIPALVALLLSNGLVISAAIIVVSLVGIHEFYKAVGLSDKKALCILGALPCLIFPLIPCLAQYIPANVISLIIYAFIFAMFLVLLLNHEKTNVKDIGMLILSVIYIPYFLSDIIRIRLLENGEFYIWIVFLAAFATDTCAYFSGIFLGKHKLCPQISPKKTIEGAVGGVLGCVIICLGYGFLMIEVLGVEVSLVKIGALGLIAAVVSEIGDLVASIIKRQHGIKDYGTIFPGHGGILDRCDSVILVAPIVYLFLSGIGIQ